jgi:hypothetical protein
MRVDLSSIGCRVERLVEDLHKRWGIDPAPLQNRLSSLLNRMPESTEAELVKALERRAREHRDAVLRPILQELDNWVRGHISHKVGDRLDDALSEAMHEVLRYWKPSWATPEGQQHLRAYALKTVRQRLGKRAQSEKVRETRDQQLDPPAPQVDPEAQSLETLEAQERAIALSKLRDIDWCVQNLTPAEADAVVRWLRGDSFSGLTANEIAAIKKALFRARARLHKRREELAKDRRRHRRKSAGYWVQVQRDGVSKTYRVIDESTGGLGLAAEDGGAALEPGADYMLRLDSEGSVFLRGARCVRVDRTAGGLRIGLQFHFQHPLPPPVRRARRAQLSP